MDSADRSASAVPKLSSRWAMAVAWPSFFMAGVMEEEFGIETDPAAFFEHPTIDGVAEIVAQLCGEAGR